MRTMRLEINVCADDSGGFFVTVPSLPGCVSQGETRKEAIKNIREALTIYILTLQSEGRPIPEELLSDSIEFDIECGTC